MMFKDRFLIFRKTQYYNFKKKYYNIKNILFFKKINFFFFYISLLPNKEKVTSNYIFETTSL